MSTDLDEFLALVRADDSHRREDVTDDLHVVDAFEAKAWSHCLPTVALRNNIPHVPFKPGAPSSYFLTKADQFPDSTYYFISRLHAHFPAVANLPEHLLPNVMFAGGAILQALTQHTPPSHRPASDLDMFIYGFSDKESALERVRQLVSAIVASANGYSRTGENKGKKRPLPREEDTLVYWNGYAVSIYVGDLWNNNHHKYQIILRSYKTASAVLHGFDLPCCAVGFLPDTKKLVATGLGKFCVEHSINLFRPSRASPSCGFRLYKYLDRGLNLVLPHLNLDKMARGRVTRFHIGDDLEVEVDVESYGAACAGSGPLLAMSAKPMRDAISDYQEDIPLETAADQSLRRQWIAIRKLAQGRGATVTQSLYRFAKDWKPTSIFSDFPIPATESDIENHYDGVLKKLTNHKVKLCVLMKHCPDVWEQLIQVYATDLAPCVKKEKYKNLIDVQMKNVLHNLQAAKSAPAIDMITVNPTAQFTSSFRPQPLTAKNCYGDLVNEAALCPE